MLKDAPFLPGYLLHCVSQKTGVINAKRRYSTHHRLPDDVCTVISPADAHFYHCQVDLFLEEDMEGHECKEAEVGRHGDTAAVLGLL
jgi:hypothetical protein